jgi:putative membrane protein
MFWLLVTAAQGHTGASVPIRGQYDWSNLPDAAPGVWIAWDLFPSIVVGCGTLLGLYVWMAGPGRRRWNLCVTGPSRREWMLFSAALLVVFGSLQGPLHALSDTWLFSAHMLQHLLITLIFPPLLIAGIPPWMWRPLVSVPWVASVGRTLTRPGVAFAIMTVRKKKT